MSHARMVHERFQEGQGLLEYSLLLVLIAVVVVIIIALYGESLANYYQFVIDELPF